MKRVTSDQGSFRQPSLVFPKGRRGAGCNVPSPRLEAGLRVRTNRQQATWIRLIACSMDAIHAGVLRGCPGQHIPQSCPPMRAARAAAWLVDRQRWRPIGMGLIGATGRGTGFCSSHLNDGCIDQEGTGSPSSTFLLPLFYLCSLCSTGVQRGKRYVQRGINGANVTPNPTNSSPTTTRIIQRTTSWRFSYAADKTLYR